MTHGDDDFDPEAEGPSNADLARFSGNTFRCGECGAMLYSGVDLCAKCGAVQFHESDVRGMRNPLLRHPWVMVAVAVLVVAGFVLLVL